MNNINEVSIRVTDGEGNYKEETLFISGSTLSIVIDKIKKKLEKDLGQESAYKERRSSYLSRMLQSISYSAK